ncbi:SDR family NAD(P)-dependent oxidoreductase, partial [Variovorax sp. CT11-76]
MTSVQDNIRGKVAIVTGASSGLGETTARHLAARGAKVVLAARRTDRLEKVVAEIREAGGEAIAVATDVAKREDLERLAAATVEGGPARGAGGHKPRPGAARAAEEPADAQVGAP